MATYSRWERWYRTMTLEQRIAYCQRAALSRRYVEIHLLNRRKDPSVQAVMRLATATQGAVKPAEVFEHFACVRA